MGLACVEVAFCFSFCPGRLPSFLSQNWCLKSTPHKVLHANSISEVAF